MNDQQTTENQPRDGDNLAAAYVPPENVDGPHVPLAEAKLGDIADSISLNIFVIGCVDSGKSALVNAFLGRKYGEQGAAKEHSLFQFGMCTQQVERRVAEAGEQRGLCIWDTPGLWASGGIRRGTDKRSLDGIQKHYQKHDLIIICIQADIRFPSGKENSNIAMMIMLNKKFGKSFWRNVIIVLTFANSIVSFNPEWSPDSRENKIKKFKAKIGEYEQEIKNNMKTYVGINPAVVDRIKVVPAGHYTNPKLLDREDWFKELWKECLSTIPTPEGQAAFVYHNQDRTGEKSEFEIGNSPWPNQIVLGPNFIPEELLRNF